MISFACRCSHRIEVEDDLAGGMLQCPACGILVDVPTLDDLKHLDPDGTYHMDEVVAKTAKLRTTPHFRDDEAIDRRQTLEEFMEIDTVPPIDQGPKRLRPHYDPLTGELIRPVEVKAEPTPAVVPGPPVRKLSYARDRSTPTPAWWRPLLDIWKPESLLVWGIVGVVLLIHLNLIGVTFPIGLFYFFSIGLIVSGLLIAHFGTVIDETGPGDRDELPTPLRQMSFTEDIWRPFFHVALALVLAFAPAIVLRVAWPGAPEPLTLAMSVLGYVLLPGYALTAVTSGYLLNLLPWRVVGTIRRIGIAYLLAALCIAGGIEALLGMASLYTAPNLVVTGLLPTIPVSEGLIELIYSTRWLPHAGAFGQLMIAMYLLHSGCWMLGLSWRRDHESFPWLMQRHLRREGSDTTSRLKRLREERQEARIRAVAAEPASQPK